MSYKSPLLQKPLPALTRPLPHFFQLHQTGKNRLRLSYLGTEMDVPQPVLDALKELTETGTLRIAFQQVRTPNFYTLDVGTAICLALFIRHYRIAQYAPFYAEAV